MSLLVGNRTVADAMVRFPKTCDRRTTVQQARAFFEDGHVHALLVVDRGVLLAVVERDDLAGCPAEEAVRVFGTLRDRTVGPATELAMVQNGMQAAARRRLAVIDDDGGLLGLLCLKRSGSGFCSDAGIRARTRAHRA